MRHKAGAAAILQKREQAQHYESLRNELAAEKLKQATASYSAFKERLVEFAQKHRNRINQDPEFRQQFHEMCTALGVDPLACNGSAWSVHLGIGNFYTRLGIRILSLCMSTREWNGGILDMQELLKLLSKQSGADKLSGSDVQRAIEKLSVLGKGGISVVKSGKNTLIVSVPSELSTDQLTCLEQAQKHGFVNFTMLNKELGWNQYRCDTCFKLFLRDGTTWKDEQSETGETCYWFPSIFFRVSGAAA